MEPSWRNDHFCIACMAAAAARCSRHACSSPCDDVDCPTWTVAAHFPQYANSAITTAICTNPVPLFHPQHPSRLPHGSCNPDFVRRVRLAPEAEEECAIQEPALALRCHQVGVSGATPPSMDGALDCRVGCMSSIAHLTLLDQAELLKSKDMHPCHQL